MEAQQRIMGAVVEHDQLPLTTGWTGRHPLQVTANKPQKYYEEEWREEKNKTQQVYELTIRRHGKASPLPNQPDRYINFNQTNMSKLKL